MSSCHDPVVENSGLLECPSLDIIPPNDEGVVARNTTLSSSTTASSLPHTPSELRPHQRPHVLRKLFYDSPINNSLLRSGASLPVGILGATFPTHTHMSGSMNIPGIVSANSTSSSNHIINNAQGSNFDELAHLNYYIQLTNSLLGTAQPESSPSTNVQLEEKSIGGRSANSSSGSFLSAVAYQASSQKVPITIHTKGPAFPSKKVFLEMEKGDSISTLKRKTEEHMDEIVASKLIFQGKILRDEQRIEELCFQPMSSIVVVGENSRELMFFGMAIKYEAPSLSNLFDDIGGERDESSALIFQQAFPDDKHCTGTRAQFPFPCCSRLIPAPNNPPHERIHLSFYVSIPNAGGAYSTFGITTFSSFTSCWYSTTRMNCFSTRSIELRYNSTSNASLDHIIVRIGNCRGAKEKRLQKLLRMHTGVLNPVEDLAVTQTTIMPSFVHNRYCGINLLTSLVVHRLLFVHFQHLQSQLPETLRTSGTREVVGGFIFSMNTPAIPIHLLAYPWNEELCLNVANAYKPHAFNGCECVECGFEIDPSLQLEEQMVFLLKAPRFSERLHPEHELKNQLIFLPMRLSLPPVPIAIVRRLFYCARQRAIFIIAQPFFLVLRQLIIQSSGYLKPESIIRVHHPAFFASSLIDSIEPFFPKDPSPLNSLATALSKEPVDQRPQSFSDETKVPSSCKYPSPISVVNAVQSPSSSSLRKHTLFIALLGKLFLSNTLTYVPASFLFLVYSTFQIHYPCK